MHSHLIKPAKLKDGLGSIQNQGHTVAEAELVDGGVLLTCSGPGEDDVFVPVSFDRVLAEFGKKPAKKKAAG